MSIIWAKRDSNKYKKICVLFNTINRSLAYDPPCIRASERQKVIKLNIPSMETFSNDVWMIGKIKINKFVLKNNFVIISILFVCLNFTYK